MKNSLQRYVVREEEEEQVNEDVEYHGQEHAQSNDIRDALCRYFAEIWMNVPNQMYSYRVMGLCKLPKQQHNNMQKSSLNPLTELGTFVLLDLKRF